MSPERCRSSVYQYFVELANGNLAAADDQLDPKSAAMFTADFISFRAALPGYQFTVEQVVVQPERVVVHWTARGRNPEAGHAVAEDELQNNQEETVPGIIAYRLAGGPAAEADPARESQVRMIPRQVRPTTARVAA